MTCDISKLTKVLITSIKLIVNFVQFFCSQPHEPFELLLRHLLQRKITDDANVIVVQSHFFFTPVLNFRQSCSQQIADQSKKITILRIKQPERIFAEEKKA